MKPAQIGLWAVGAAMCAISIGFLFDDIGRGGHQTPMGEAPSRSAPAQELAALVTPESPQTDQLDVLDPVAQDSSHAIVPDTPQVTAPSPPAEATTPSADLPTSQATAPSPEPAVKEASPPITSQPLAHANPSGDPSASMPRDELVTITSAAIIRSGPSSSADIIGRAHTGAKARVAATDSGWAQIVDPASGNKGWVESSVLTPSATTETAAIDSLPDVAAPGTLPEDQRAAMPDDRYSATRSKHSAKAKRQRAKHHHGRRRFAFRFVIRGFLR
jgi:Bacterial SH3 domain